MFCSEKCVYRKGTTTCEWAWKEKKTANSVWGKEITLPADQGSRPTHNALRLPVIFSPQFQPLETDLFHLNNSPSISPPVVFLSSLLFPSSRLTLLFFNFFLCDLKLSKRDHGDVSHNYAPRHSLSLSLSPCKGLHITHSYKCNFSFSVDFQCFQYDGPRWDTFFSFALNMMSFVKLFHICCCFFFKVKISP